MQQAPHAPRFVSIGAVSEALGVAPSTLRLWESRGLIPPAERIGGADRRVYGESEIETLRLVAEAQRRRRKGAPALAS